MVSQQLSSTCDLLPQDMFFLDTLIVARLEAQLPGVIIESFFGRPKVDEAEKVEPTVMLFLESDLLPSSANKGRRVKVTQKWTALGIVDASTDSPGALRAKITKALSGWTPDTSLVESFLLVESDFQHEYSPNLIFYFPVSFKTHFVFNTED